MKRHRRTLVFRHQDQLKQHPKLDWNGIFDNPHTTLFEFDSLVTAPLGGHETAIAYYRSASATRFIDQVSVPLLSLSAMNDPVVCSGGIPLEAATKNPNLVFALTKHGGHLGWFEGLLRPRRWIAKPVVEFLKALHEADPTPRRKRATVPAVSKSGRRPEIGDEMVLVEGRSDLGFKRVGAKEHGAVGGEPVDGAPQLTQGL